MKLRNIGRYQVKQELDHGGMSVVYLARDPRFQRDVAIKVLSRNLQGQANTRARFEREARIIAGLNHPAIVTVYDFGEDDGAPYLVMRYMPGGSLSDLLAYGRLNLTDSARIAERIAGALDVAHSQGLVHRDLKPANILFDASGDAFLTDFGIVKIFESESNEANITGSVVLGTPAYMSPEQALGKTIDKRSDVYSLGAVIYEMLTGVPPYKGPTSVSVAMKHVLDPVPQVKEYRPDIAESINALVTKAMAKEAVDRQPGASALAAEFSRAVGSLPADAQTGNIPSAVTRKPITEANQRIKARPSVVEAERAAVANPPSEYQGSSDTVINRNNRTLLWIGIAAGIFAFLGIAMFVISSLIGDPASPTEPATALPPTLAVLIPPPATVAPIGGETATTAPIVIVPSATAAAVNIPQPIMDVIDGIWNLRGGPGLNYPVLGQIREGARLGAQARTRGLDGRIWYEIKLQDGRRAWLREDAVIINRANLAAFDVLPESQSIPPTPVSTNTTVPTATPTATLLPVPTMTPTRTPTALAGPASATPIPLFTSTVGPTQTPAVLTSTPTIVASPTATETPLVTSTTSP